MNALVALIVIAAAFSVVWRLAPVRLRYDTVRALHDALPAQGYAGRLARGIMAPLVRRAAKGLGGGCGSCPANPLRGDAGPRRHHARTPH